MLFPHPFAIAKPFEKSQADKAQLDVLYNNRYPDINLPSRSARTDKLLRMILGSCRVFTDSKSDNFCYFSGNRLGLKFQRQNKRRAEAVN